MNNDDTMSEGLSDVHVRRLIRLVSTLEAVIRAEILDRTSLRVVENALGIADNDAQDTVGAKKEKACSTLSDLNRQLRRSIGDDLAEDD